MSTDGMRVKSSSPIQFFFNEADWESRRDIERMEAAGYRIQFLATSGPAALWIDGQEIVGRNAIAKLVRQLT